MHVYGALCKILKNSENARKILKNGKIYTERQESSLEASGLRSSLEISENILNYRVYANRTQAKKIISNLVCAQLESKQFQEVNFLALIRCCVVIEQLA